MNSQQIHIHDFAFILPRLLFFAFAGLMVSCVGKSGNQESLRFQQYYVQGEQLYIKNCSNCHQKSGKGLGKLYPPLNSSDFMDANLKKVFCLMKFGIEGDMKVNGLNFNKPMPGVPSLTELEIAEISTYIYNAWDHKRGMISTGEVLAAIDSCGNQRFPD